jgi:hypothetical protein
VGGARGGQLLLPRVPQGRQLRLRHLPRQHRRHAGPGPRARGGLRAQVLRGRRRQQGTEARTLLPRPRRRRRRGGVRPQRAAVDAADAVHGQVQAGAREGGARGSRGRGERRPWVA